jgi:hypothetical protein
MVLQQKLPVDAGELGIHTFDVGHRTQARKVLVARLVFGEEQLVVPVVFLAFLARKRFLVAVFHEVEFAPYDGLDVVFVRLGYEVERAEHVAVVGHCDG